MDANTVSILLPSNDIILFSEEDRDLVIGIKWYCVTNSSGNKYARGSFQGRRVFMHRHILGLVTNDERQVDHINHNGLDNRRENIRICTRAQNQANKRQQRGTSKFKGVFFHTKANKWAACISLAGRNIYLGVFEKEHEAALAYDTKATVLFGEFACTNASLGLLDAYLIQREAS